MRRVIETVGLYGVDGQYTCQKCDQGTYGSSVNRHSTSLSRRIGFLTGMESTALANKLWRLDGVHTRHAAGGSQNEAFALKTSLQL